MEIVPKSGMTVKKVKTGMQPISGACHRGAEPLVFRFFTKGIRKLLTFEIHREQARLDGKCLVSHGAPMSLLMRAVPVKASVFPLVVTAPPSQATICSIPY